MKNTTTSKRNFQTVISEKRALMDVIEQLIRSLDDMERDKLSDWKVVGKETEQAKSWKTDELYWTDENGRKTLENTGLPYYDDKYDYVLKSDDELDEQDKAYQRVIENMRETLASMV